MQLSYIVLYFVVLKCILFNPVDGNTKCGCCGSVKSLGPDSGKHIPLDVNLRIPHNPLYTFIENPRKVTTIYQYFIYSSRINQLTDGNTHIWTVPDGARCVELMIVSEKKTDKAMLVRLVYELCCCRSRLMLFSKDNNAWMTVEHEDFVDKWRDIDPIDAMTNELIDSVLSRQRPIVITDDSSEVTVDVSVRFSDMRLIDGSQFGTHTVMHYYKPLTGTKNKIKKVTDTKFTLWEPLSSESISKVVILAHRKSDVTLLVKLYIDKCCFKNKLYFTKINDEWKGIDRSEFKELWDKFSRGNFTYGDHEIDFGDAIIPEEDEEVDDIDVVYSELLDLTDEDLRKSTILYKAKLSEDVKDEKELIEAADPTHTTIDITLNKFDQNVLRYNVSVDKKTQVTKSTFKLVNKFKLVKLVKSNEILWSGGKFFGKCVDITSKNDVCLIRISAGGMSKNFKYLAAECNTWSEINKDEYDYRIKFINGDKKFIVLSLYGIVNRTSDDVFDVYSCEKPLTKAFKIVAKEGKPINKIIFNCSAVYVNISNSVKYNEVYVYTRMGQPLVVCVYYVVDKKEYNDKFMYNYGAWNKISDEYFNYLIFKSGMIQYKHLIALDIGDDLLSDDISLTKLEDDCGIKIHRYQTNHRLGINRVLFDKAIVWSNEDKEDYVNLCDFIDVYIKNKKTYLLMRLTLLHENGTTFVYYSFKCNKWVCVSPKIYYNIWYQVRQTQMHKLFKHCFATLDINNLINNKLFEIKVIRKDNVVCYDHSPLPGILIVKIIYDKELIWSSNNPDKEYCTHALVYTNDSIPSMISILTNSNSGPSSLYFERNYNTWDQKLSNFKVS